MAKELPFYKFTANEWLTGDICFESFDVQGLFISVCATYWSKDCSITLAKLKQRLNNATEEQWQCLIDGGYIKVKNEKVSISFLDEQMSELSEQHRKKVEAGRKGGQASVKQRLSKGQASVKHKDIDIDIDVEEEQDEEEDILTPSDFDQFWQAYGKQQGRYPCETLWRKLEQKDIDKILEHVPKFVKASGEYLINPKKYLEDRRWMDEELPDYGKEQKNNTPKGRGKIVIPL